MEIRVAGSTEADYGMVVAIKNAVYTDEPVSVRQLRHQQESWKPGFLFGRLIVEKNGQAVATACYFENFWQYQPGKYDLEILVHPAYQGQGIGSALYDHVLGILTNRTPEATSLVASTREDQPRGMRFLSSRGFRPQLRWARSRLNLADFAAENWAEIVLKVQNQGISIHSLEELQAW